MNAVKALPLTTCKESCMKWDYTSAWAWRDIQALNDTCSCVCYKLDAFGRIKLPIATQKVYKFLKISPILACSRRR